MNSSNGLVVLISAIGSVTFLFVMDYYWRFQEKRAENMLDEIKEEAQTQPCVKLNEDGDENMAA